MSEARNIIDNLKRKYCGGTQRVNSALFAGQVLICRNGKGSLKQFNTPKIFKELMGFTTIFQIFVSMGLKTVL